MGEETNIIKELVQVTSPDALQNYLSRILSTGFYEDEQSKEYHTDIAFALKKGLSENGGKTKLSFSGMNGWKIISFWYPPLIQTFHNLRQIVAGEVTLKADDEIVIIKWEGGDCTFSFFESEDDVTGEVHTIEDVAKFLDVKLIDQIESCNSELNKEVAEVISRQSLEIETNKSKISSETILQVKKMIAEGKPMAETAKMLGVSLVTCRKIEKGAYDSYLN